MDKYCGTVSSCLVRFFILFLDLDITDLLFCTIEGPTVLKKGLLKKWVFFSSLNCTFV